MSSQFDMNAPQRCRICLDNHSKATRCSYDLLVNYVMSLRMENVVYMGKLKEAVQTAQAFQNIIKSIEPELVRLVATELKYKALTGEINGTEELHTEAPKSGGEEVQLQSSDRQNVRPNLGVVQTEVP